MGSPDGEPLVTKRLNERVVSTSQPYAQRLLPDFLMHSVLTRGLTLRETQPSQRKPGSMPELRRSSRCWRARISRRSRYAATAATYLADRWSSGIQTRKDLVRGASSLRLYRVFLRACPISVSMAREAASGSGLCRSQRQNSRRRHWPPPRSTSCRYAFGETASSSHCRAATQGRLFEKRVPWLHSLSCGVWLRSCVASCNGASRTHSMPRYGRQSHARSSRE